MATANPTTTTPFCHHTLLFITICTSITTTLLFRPHPFLLPAVLTACSQHSICRRMANEICLQDNIMYEYDVIHKIHQQQRQQEKEVL